jgi:hypothetical protein
MNPVNGEVSPILILNEKDNVGVARAAVPAGTEIVAHGSMISSRETITP